MYRCEKVKRFKILKTELVKSSILKKEKELTHFLSMNSKIEFGLEIWMQMLAKKADDCHFDATFGTQNKNKPTSKILARSTQRTNTFKHTGLSKQRQQFTKLKALMIIS